MIFIYEKSTGEVKAFYSGDVSQINNYDNPDWGEAQFPDDHKVLSCPHDYKVVVYNGRPITYQKKPELKLTLDKEEIVGDGEDYAVLKVEIEGVHPLEKERFNSTEIDINNNKIQVVNGEEVEIASYNSNVFIHGNPNVFRGDTLRKRIVVGQKPDITPKNEVEEMRAKIEELERKLIEIEIYSINSKNTDVKEEGA